MSTNWEDAARETLITAGVTTLITGFGIGAVMSTVGHGKTAVIGSLLLITSCIILIILAILTKVWRILD